LVYSVSLGSRHSPIRSWPADRSVNRCSSVSGSPIRSHFFLPATLAVPRDEAKSVRGSAFVPVRKDHRYRAIPIPATLFLDASSHWRRAPERQSARAGGPRGRADRAKSTSRRTYCARNFAVSEFSPAAQSLETSGFCRSDAVTTQPPPGPPAPSSGRCANALEVEPAERHTERHKPNPARTVRSLSPFPGQELMRSSSQRRRNLSVRETDFQSRGTPACESREKAGTALRG